MQISAVRARYSDLSLDRGFNRADVMVFLSTQLLSALLLNSVISAQLYMPDLKHQLVLILNTVKLPVLTCLI